LPKVGGFLRVLCFPPPIIIQNEQLRNTCNVEHTRHETKITNKKKHNTKKQEDEQHGSRKKKKEKKEAGMKLCGREG
jgi:hypothetical protein